MIALSYDNHLYMKLLSFFALFTFFSVALPAGPISEEYKKTEQEIAEAELDPTKQTRQLEETLLESMRAALVRFHNYLNHKDISAADITYEPAGDSAKDSKYTYYIKYGEFLGYFVFPQDPKLYFVYPIQQNVIVKPGFDVPRFEVVVDDWGHLAKESNRDKKTETNTKTPEKIQ